MASTILRRRTNGKLNMKKRRAFVIDLEANNLYPYQTQVWTLRIKRVKTDEWLKINPFSFDGDVRQEVINFIFGGMEQGDECPVIAFHNGLGYDLWVLWKDFNIDFQIGPDKLCGLDVQFFDTLYASQYLLPDREGGHSLKSWGIRMGDHKIDYRELAIEKGVITKKDPDGAEFRSWIPEMDIYCEKDCLITEQIFLDMFRQVTVEATFSAFKLGQKTFYLMAAQGFTGFKFDRVKAISLQPRIENMINDLKDEIEPDLPVRELKKGEQKDYVIPKKPHKIDGSFSKTMLNFLEKHDGIAINNAKISIYGVEILIYPGLLLNVKLPMKLDDQMALKDWFLEQGWEPTMWNLKKINGKPARDDHGQVIRTSPKIQESGKICPNLLELDGELPQKIVRFLSLKNRLGILKGWLKHERLDWDGRIPAGSTGIASTHRQKHTVVVNVPKAQDDVLLGKDFRSLWIVDEGNKLIGCDQAALEARCEGHWTSPYDGGMSARELIDGDCHSKNALAFFPKETAAFDINSADFDKDAPTFKPYRSKSKNGKYAITYGASPPKVASTLGLPQSRGKELFDAFWKANPALKKLKDAIEKFWIHDTNKKWIPGIDGRRLYSRSQHSLVNLLFQSTGAVIVDYSLCLFDKVMGGLTIDEMGRPHYLYKGHVVKRVQYTHDEFGVECPEPIAPEIAHIMEWSMAEAGVKLNLSIPLIGEAKIGNNWSETH